MDRQSVPSFMLTLRLSLCACSALAVLASGSGVSTERETFMDLVKTEITRLNGEVSNRGSMSMVFHHGGVHVSPQLHTTHCLYLQTSALCMLFRAACRHASASFGSGNDVYLLLVG